MMRRGQLRAIYTLTSFLVPVAGASQLPPVNWRVSKLVMPMVPEFHWCQSLVPVGFNIAHDLCVCRQLTPETGTGCLYQKTGQCVWPFRLEGRLVST